MKISDTDLLTTKNQARIDSSHLEVSRIPTLGREDPLSAEARDHAYLWHPFTAMDDWLQRDPLIIESGEGVRVRDIHGREYYDGNSSLWVNVHGHHHPRIDDAIRKQLDKIAHTTMLGLSNPLAIDLAERLVKIAPGSLSRVFYSDSGSEAVEIALKIAYQHHVIQGDRHRSHYLTLANGYHGDTIGAVSVGGIAQFHALFKPLLFQTHWAPSPGLVKVEPSRPTAALDAFVSMLTENADRLAAVILEPMIQAAGGMALMPPGFLKGVERACREHGVLLIVDEVATGFGRTGRMFACEHEDVHPDLMCVAKGITGGYLPLSATLVTEAVFQPFRNPEAVFFHGHSYTGNALACAAALASLDLFEENRVIEGLASKIDLIRRRLEPVAAMEHVVEVRQLGMMIGIEIVQNKAGRIPYPAELAMGARVCRRARELGMITRPLGDVVIFMPPLASTREDLNAMLDILIQSLDDVTSESDRSGDRD